MWIDDDLLRRCAEPVATSTWVPKSPMVVLGSSNDPAAEVDVEACGRDGVPILKRYGGGGTVLLYAGCVVVSVGTWVRQHFQNKLYFHLLNQAVIECLAARWPRLLHLGQKGLSDITLEDRKVAGTSLFRSRNYLLYQASILVHLDTVAIARYLKHPTREPDYRAGRKHHEFLVGLGEVEPALTVEACHVQLAQHLDEVVARVIGDELVAPEPAQFAGLLRRAEHGVP